jgi:hypothetical protein
MWQSKKNRITHLAKMAALGKVVNVSRSIRPRQRGWQGSLENYAASFGF